MTLMKNLLIIHKLFHKFLNKNVEEIILYFFNNMFGEL